MLKFGKKTRINNKIYKLNGGKYLGQGSFGCVISPALHCNKYSKSTKRYSIPRDDVSKIISRTDDDESINTEIDVSNKLKQIDPHQKYFLYIKEHCKIRDVPKERSNIASVRYLDDNSIELRHLDKKKLDKHHCEVDLKLKPRNFVLSNGGKELGDVLHVYSKMYNATSVKYKSQYADELAMTSLFYKNFKYHFKYLLEGIYKLHQNNIVQRDIKIENIMIDWTSQSKHNIILRYIDFGLSEILTSQYRSSKYNIHSQGTPELIPPDIIIASEMKKYYKYDKDHIYPKILRELDKTVKKMFVELHLNTSNIKPTSIILIERIQKEFIDKTILLKYFGEDNDKFNGYIHKTDIYALGLTLYEILHKYCKDKSFSHLKKNSTLLNLLKNMIELDPDKRFNIIQCLQHPYFK